MPEPRHIVRRQTLDLTVSSDAQARLIQDQVRAMHGARLMPVMDEVLTSLVGDGEIVQLERIDLDLGRVPVSQLERALTEGLRAQLTHVVGEEIAHLRSTTEVTANGRIVRPTDAKLEIIRRFLDSGTLPWWTTAPMSLDPSALVTELVEHRPAAVRDLLLGLPSAPTARRLVRQFATPLLRGLVAVLAQDQAPRFEQDASDWTRVLVALWQTDAASLSSVAVTSVADIEILVREQTLAFLMEERAPPRATEALSTVVLARFGKLEWLAEHQLVAQARHLLPQESSVRNWIETRAVSTAEQGGIRLAADTDQAVSGQQQEDDAGSTLRDHTDGQPVSTPWAGEVSFGDVSERQASGDALVRRAQQSAGTADGEVSPQSIDAVAPDDSSPAGTETGPADESAIETIPVETLDDGEQHYIENAGLILVWPFLPRFLAQVGLVEKDAFKSEAAQERGVLLLQHLASDGTSWPEHLLLLNKLLCGWSPWEPTARAIDLSELEREECHDLLAALIGHWKMLKGTSVEGFQSSFLQREGRLAPQETGWHLLVARCGYDVLLDSLPWGIGTVRLPWMAAPLFVEW